MKRNNSIFFIALLLSVLPACFYADSEMYEVEPIPGDPPLLTVSTNLDSLINPPVNDSLQVNYHVDISGGDFYYVYADVFETTIFESDSIDGSFWINRSMADSTGVDTLYMEFYHSSNSNSLADRVGYEALVEYLKFAVDFNLEDTR